MVTLKNCPIKIKTKKRLQEETDINWICNKCGEKRYHRKVGCATWHKDLCDVCKTFQMVTEPRDFIRGDHI